MSDLAEKILEAAQARAAEENAKTKEVAWHACPTCSERADRYEIVKHELVEVMRSTVKLFPCEHLVIWSEIQRVPDTISMADPEILRWCEMHQEIAALHKQADAPYAWMCELCGDEGQTMDCTYPCDTLRIMARGYGLEVEG